MLACFGALEACPGSGLFSMRTPMGSIIKNITHHIIANVINAETIFIRYSVAQQNELQQSAFCQIVA